MSLKDRLLLSLLKLVLFLEGWKEVKPSLWKHGECQVTGDGSEIMRLIMRRLRAGERLYKERKRKNDR